MGVLILLLTTVIWGTAFLAQKLGGEALSPLALTVFRSVLGGLFLLGTLAVRRRSPVRPPIARSVFAGVASGIPLFLAILTQQIGIQYTTPGVSAFLTTNYVLFVPLLGAFFVRRLPVWHVWAAAAAALGGTYLICLAGAGSEAGFAGVGKGELWTILCALLFSVQMLVVERVTRDADVLVMSIVQLFTCAVLGAPFLFLPSEASQLSVAAVLGAWKPLVYLGVFSSGIAYTLQNVGQARVSASLAGVVLSLESVFGALSGWIALGDVLSPVQIAGCGLVFGAVLFAQFKSR